MNVALREWTLVGTLNDIPAQGARRIASGDLTIAIFRTATDHVYAVNDSCPNRGGPLSNGIVHGANVTCPICNWVISLESGEAQGADEGATQSYPVRRDGSEIYLNLST